MTTVARALAIPAAALILLGACSGDDDSAADGSDTAAGVTDPGATTTGVTTPASTVAPTAGASTTVASTTATSPAPTAAPPPTAAPATAPPTTDPVTGDRPVAGGTVEIIVVVGVDDAATVGERVERLGIGSDVELRLYSDSAEEYHIHDLDLEQAVPAGVEAVFQFVADRPGRFDVESHATGQVLATLEVA